MAAIDDKCTYNHHAFYTSVEDLIEVRSLSVVLMVSQVQMEFRSLKDDIFALNQKLQSTGNRMLNQADELVCSSVSSSRLNPSGSEAADSKQH